MDAFLELPFVVFAYLTVCRWFSPEVYRRALRLTWPASASYTATFCLIEWRLHNPYTVDDIVIRIAAAIVVPLWAACLSRESHNRTDNLPRLLAFTASVLGLGLVILVVYDTALLYNLGHLAAKLRIGSAALIIVATARCTAPWVPGHPPGRCIDVVARSFGWLLVVFFIPALPIRYGLGFEATNQLLDRLGFHPKSYQENRRTSFLRKAYGWMVYPLTARARSPARLLSTSRWRRTMSRSFGLRTSRSAGAGRPGRHDQTRSNRSRFITLSHAATKSFTNFSFASSLA